jgi:inactivated superfamily I helicase
VTTHAYEIRVVGSLGPAARDALADAALEVEPTATVISACLDQPALHALLDQVRALGLELLDIKQYPDHPG